MTGSYILVSHGTEVIVSVLPQYVVSTPNIHDYSPEKYIFIHFVNRLKINKSFFKDASAFLAMNDGYGSSALTRRAIVKLSVWRILP